MNITRSLMVLPLAVVLFTANPARAEESTGVPLLVVGSVLAVGGGITLGASTLCRLPAGPGDVRMVTPQAIEALNTCRLGSAAAGGTALVLSLPALVLGASSRLEWLGRVRPTVTPQGGSLSWSGTF